MIISQIINMFCFTCKLDVIIYSENPERGKSTLLLDGGLVKGYLWRIWVIIDTPHPASGWRSSKRVPVEDLGNIDTPHPASGRRSSKRVPVEDLGNNRHPSPCMS